MKIPKFNLRHLAVLAVLLLCAVSAGAQMKITSGKKIPESYRDAVCSAQKALIGFQSAKITDVPPEEQAYLFVPEFMAEPESRFYTAGSHTVIGFYNNTNTKNGHPVGQFTIGKEINVTFEAGKYYTFEYEHHNRTIGGGIMLSIVEITDAEELERARQDKADILEPLGAYLDYMKSHPYALDGTYSFRQGLSNNGLRIRQNLIYAGSARRVEAGKNTAFNGEPIILYDDETMIFLRESSLTAAGYVPTIWHYHFNGDKLDIIYGDETMLNQLTVTKYIYTVESRGTE